MSDLFHLHTPPLKYFLTTLLLFSLSGCLPSRPEPQPPNELVEENAVKKQNDKLTANIKKSPPQKNFFKQKPL